MDHPTTRSAQELAAFFGQPDSFGFLVLGALGVQPEANDQFEVELAASAMKRRLLGATAAPAPPPSWLAAAQMGPDEESCRRLLQAVLEQHGMQVVGHGMRNGMRMTLRHPEDDRTLRILTYVALNDRPDTHQVGFAVNHLDADEGDFWVVLIAKPLGRIFLRRKSEILERVRRRRKGRTPATATVTVSPGTTTNLLVDRLREFLNAPEWT